MKKLLYAFCAVAMVAIALTGCSKNEAPVNDESVVGIQKNITFNALPGSSTKSYFGEKTSAGYPTVWTENSKVAIALNYGNKKDAVVTPKADGMTASFDAEITDDNSGDYTFYAISPATSAITSYVSKGYNSFTIDFPASQTPTLTSVDEAAHIMFGESESYSELPEKVDLKFNHIAAYGRFQLKNFSNDVKISSISLKSDEVFAGRFYYYVKDSESSSYLKGDIAPNSAGNTISIDPSKLYEDATSNSDMVFWFSCAPVNLEGKNLKLTVNTDAGMYVKTITFPAGKGNFKSGKIASFNVDMDGITTQSDEIYTLVTNVKELTEDSKVIIVAADHNSAMGTTQNSNNRAIVSITKESTTPLTIKNPESNGAQIFVLEAGSVENTIAFNCENGIQAGKYIYTPGGGNYLRSQDNADANASFSVTIDANGNAVLKSSSAFNQVFVRYNSNSSLFSAYAEGSSVQDAVSIYKLNGSGLDGEQLIIPTTSAPVISYDSENHIVTITCPDDAAVIGYTIDGNEPSLNEDGTAIGSTLIYSAPFEIEETTLVKAVAVVPGIAGSKVVEKNCVVSTGDNSNVVTINWTVGASNQTWSAATDNTYGAGFAAKDAQIEVAYYKHTSSSMLNTAYQDHIRIYKGAVLVITPIDASKKIVGVTLNTTNKNYTFNMSVLSDDNAEATSDADNLVITWSNASGIDSFVAHAAYGQCRVKSIKVELAD